MFETNVKNIKYTCKKGNLELLKTQLDKLNHDENENIYSLLVNTALRHGQWEIASYLYKNHTIYENTKLPAIIAATQYKQDQTEGLKLVISKWKNVDQTCDRGRTALMTASLMAHTKKIKLLLQHCQNIEAKDENGMTAFLDAVCSKNIQTVQMIAEQDINHHCQNSNGENALFISVNEKKPDKKIISYLLELGIDPDVTNKNGESALNIAEHKNPAIFKIIKKSLNEETQLELPFLNLIKETKNSLKKNVSQKNNPNNTNTRSKKLDEWFDSAINNKLGRLHQLLKNNIEIDATDEKGCTALIHACGSGNRAIASFLLQHSANIEHKSKNGSTALSSAIISNSRAVIQLLLERGANPNKNGPGGYPYVTLASAQWNESSLSQLYEYKANLNIKDSNGYGLLHTAAIAAEYYTNTIKAKNTIYFLLNKKLDVNSTDNNGNTPLAILCGAHKVKRYQVDDSRIATLAHELLKSGAHPDHVNNAGLTAAKYAHKHRLKNTHGVILSFLENWSVN